MNFKFKSESTASGKKFNKLNLNFEESGAAGAPRKFCKPLTTAKRDPEAMVSNSTTH